MDLLKASMQESKGEIRQVFHEYLENTLGKMSTEKEKQEFITKMAEKIPLSYDKGSFGYKQQFILANEAREFGLRAEGKKGLSNNNDVRRVAGYVADLYKKQANGEKGISAYKAYVALCERCSTTEEKDLVKNTVREKLSRETYALTAMTKDIIRYEKEYVQDLNKVKKRQHPKRRWRTWRIRKKSQRRHGKYYDNQCRPRKNAAKDRTDSSTNGR